VKKPNLCIVTEFMKQGSLKDILANNGIKLTWKQKMRLLRSAALGINYLHSLHPVIVHRDLKPSNLLVRRPFFGALRGCDHMVVLLVVLRRTRHVLTLRKFVTGGRELERKSGRLRVRAHQRGERDNDPLRHALLDGTGDHPWREV
jgi:hypothetical protein